VIGRKGVHITVAHDDVEWSPIHFRPCLMFLPLTYDVKNVSYGNEASL